MEKLITEKLDSLMKYLPFIDYIIELDKQKFVKFIDIRKWIIGKKRYPLSDLQKIEQSIITQYTNLVANSKIPKELMKIFNTKFDQIDLCSDDEEEGESEQHKNKELKNKKDDKIASSSSSKEHAEKERKKAELEKRKDLSKKSEEKPSTSHCNKEKHLKKDEKQEKVRASSSKEHTERERKIEHEKGKETFKKSERERKLSTSCSKEKDSKSSTSYNKERESKRYDEDDDDDLKFVSVEYLNQDKRTQNQNSATEQPQITPKQELNLDDVSAELLKKIDILNTDNEKYQTFHEPNNYFKVSDDEDEVAVTIKEEKLFQRRKSDDLLFKRRNDFKDSDHDVTKALETNEKQEEPVKHKNHMSHSSNRSTSEMETISLDTSSESEGEETIVPAKAPATSSTKEPINQSSKSNQISSASSKKDELNKMSNKEKSPPPDVIILSQDMDVEESLNVEEAPKNNNSNTSAISNEATKPTAKNVLATSENSNHSLESDIDLLDMDLDTENDLNDVLNEMETSNTTLNISCDETTNFRNPSPPKQRENNTNNNSLSSPAPSNSSSDLNNLQNLTEEEILRIFDESKSDDEMDKILKALIDIFNMNSQTSKEGHNLKENTPPVSANAVNNVSNLNKVTPPVPHMAPVAPIPLQYPPAQAPQQQPIFYPNPIQPSQFPPLPNTYHPQQQYPPQQQFPPQHHQPQLQKPMPPHQYNDSTHATQMPRREPNFNLRVNDPRVIKQLQMIKNSPLWNEFNRKTAENLINQSQQHQPHQPQTFATVPNNQQQNLPRYNTVVNPHQLTTSAASAASTSTPAPINSRRKSLTKSTICYAEYKRRQAEKLEEAKRQQEEEKKRKEEELKAKQAEEVKEREKLEQLKQTNEIRSILLSTLEPYKDEISTVWEQHNKTASSASNSKQNEATTSKETSCNSNEQQPTKPTEEKRESPTQKETSSKRDGQKQMNDKMNRIHKELECTFKGFDQLQDYVPKTIGGKRRSSVHARTAISEQLNSEASDTISGPTKSNGNKTRSSVLQRSDNSESDFEPTTTPKPIGNRRRSSIYARSAIQQQLGDNSDSDINSSQRATTTPKPIGAKRRSSIFAASAIEEQLKQQEQYISLDNSDSSDLTFQSSSAAATTKRRKTIDEPIQATRRVKTFIIRDEDDGADEDSSSDEQGDFEKFRSSKLAKLKEGIMQNQPKVVVRRISEEFIRKHSKRKVQALNSSNVLDIHLVESTKSANTLEKPSAPAVAKKVAKLKRYNNDCQMTERNSRFCVLCTSKPSDLTNHYIRKHRTESYVSRLSWAKLEELELNTPFAKLQTGKFRTKYLVDCPFCDEELVETFMELYDHYSTHTGEFAYQCGHCQLDKPFRSEIVTHLKRSKTCRNSNIQVLYRYPANSHCIYIHYCSICNFVQLNEANVLKHLREHHNPRDAIAKNVTKCILVAISDAPDINESNETTSPEKAETAPKLLDVTPMIEEEKKPELQFKVDDDDIPVNNEACSEDIYECDEYSLEELLQKMHEEPATTSRAAAAPMTVIHCDANSSNINSTNVNKTVPSKEQKPPPQQQHLPPQQPHVPIQIKVEPMETSPLRSSSSAAGNVTCVEPAALNAVPPTSQRSLQVPSMEVDETYLIATPLTSTESVAINNPTASKTGTPTISKRYPQITPSKFPAPMVVDINLLTPPPESISSVAIKNPATLKATANVLKSYPVYEKYHTYPANVNYLGLFKCMADDCYYSTDISDEFLKHLNDHSQDCSPTEYLHCPYCTVAENIPVTIAQLIEHVHSEHRHMIYQCSICCYRSCEASNVLVHQQQDHAGATNLQIFKCSGTEVNSIEKQSYINGKVLENVQKLKCPYCSTHAYYSCNLLKLHFYQHHKIPFAKSSEDVYSCIYCPYLEREKYNIEKHVCIKHPEELPYVYNHNNVAVLGEQDILNVANILNLAQPVDSVEVKPICDSGEEKLLQDVKPELSELIKMNEDTVLIRLRKLTANTGVAPDSLYRCPETNCGGFFSVYDLWLRHMKVRHRCLECQCPHCPAPHPIGKENIADNMRTLESYKEHFEEHRRHTYICFHCSLTMTHEVGAKRHAVEHHSSLGNMRFEQIRCNINYSYFIMVKSELYGERVEFIAQLLPILEQRLKDMEIIEIQKLKCQWLLQNNAAEWLEDLPNLNFNRRRLPKKCFVDACSVRVYDDNLLFEHLNLCHPPYRTLYNCHKCKQKIQCENWNDVADHTKLHQDETTIFVCGACFQNNASRSKLGEHIREQHAARDVPVIQLIRTSQQIIYIKVAVVFANNQLTFSTIRNCFCCTEKHMKGDALNLHLRRYHKLTLHHFCEWCPNTQFKTLEEVKGHFLNSHPATSIKIRCELASSGELRVISLNEFQLEVVNEHQEKALKMINVKEEPKDLSGDESDDDDVIIIDEDDVVIQESLRNQQLSGECKKPKLKCIAMGNLLQNPTSTSTNSTISTQLTQLTTAITPSSSSSERPTQPSGNVVYTQTYLPPAAHINSNVGTAQGNNSGSPTTATGAQFYQSPSRNQIPTQQRLRGSTARRGCRPGFRPHSSSSSIINNANSVPPPPSSSHNAILPTNNNNCLQTSQSSSNPPPAPTSSTNSTTTLNYNRPIPSIITESRVTNIHVNSGGAANAQYNIQPITSQHNVHASGGNPYYNVNMNVNQNFYYRPNVNYMSNAHHK